MKSYANPNLNEVLDSIKFLYNNMQALTKASAGRLQQEYETICTKLIADYRVMSEMVDIIENYKIQVAELNKIREFVEIQERVMRSETGEIFVTRVRLNKSHPAYNNQVGCIVFDGTETPIKGELHIV